MKRWLRASVVLLPEETRLHVVSLPALVTLKLTAWPERRLTEPGKDAQDFFLVLSRYLDAGQADRLYGEAAHLLDEPDFDYARAGARLLGADVRRFLEAAGSHATIADLGRLLVSETDPNQPLRLVQDARPAEVDEALALLQVLSEGVRGGVALAGHASISPDFFDTSWRHVDRVDAPSRAPTAGREPGDTW